MRAFKSKTTIPLAAAIIISALVFYVKNAKKIYLYTSISTHMTDC